MFRKIVSAAAAVSLCFAVTTLGAAPAEAANKKYKNCTALNKDYKHGVGKKGAKDKTRSGSNPVTNFKRSNAIYKKNKKSDRDKDGIACEKH